MNCLKVWPPNASREKEDGEEKLACSCCECFQCYAFNGKEAPEWTGCAAYLPLKRISCTERSFVVLGFI